MERNNGPWTIQSTERKYKDEFIELCVDSVSKPDGTPGTYATVQLKRGVAILPMDNAGNVYLARQFRYAIGQDSIEVISGGVEADEDPVVAAQREAKEELGIEGAAWTEMGYFHLEASIIPHAEKCTGNAAQK
jgi:8-oxo-dGTP pyrophosphatase MutT (NUDIX family)